jgi:hypothetical protein
MTLAALQGWGLRYAQHGARHWTLFSGWLLPAAAVAHEGRMHNGCAKSACIDSVPTKNYYRMQLHASCYQLAKRKRLLHLALAGFQKKGLDIQKERTGHSDPDYTLIHNTLLLSDRASHIHRPYKTQTSSLWIL